ncbi:hypothetical protein HUJ04_009729 [Dendroctonus ponderosae]|nr:hypothetical protein HUJ04_009729 [Dendroctonus ponderosae]
MFVGVSTKTACPCGSQGVVQSLDVSLHATTLVRRSVRSPSSSVEDMKIAWLVLASCVLVLAHAAVPYFDDDELVSEEAETAITEQTIVVTTARADAIYGVPTVGANEWGSSKNGANFSK